jgi:hypothetical protein
MKNTYEMQENERTVYDLREIWKAQCHGRDVSFEIAP